MIDINTLIDNENLTESDMLESFSVQSGIINTLGSSVKNLLKHCRLQLGLGLLLYVFEFPNYFYIPMFIMLTLTFLVASYRYNIRNEEMKNFEHLIMIFKNKKLLSEENQYILKDFKINLLWFD